ncbi:MAG: peptidyl-prolyl cis-trans isomerase [Prevotella sp.]|nr:peptidyl-prolyl cis-trans isomerase [Prevotella sp.]
MNIRKLCAICAICGFTTASAQTSDPVIMVINGQPVPRSEFEYSFNKNNAEGVIDKKNVEEYLDLFINYKLKVEAAKDAKLDTMTSFKQEFASYRDQQIRPVFITDADVEAEAQKIYKETQTRIDSMGGMIKPAHILLMLSQQATVEQQNAAKVRIDSIYNALKKGADFGDLARRLSQDKGSAAQGGELPWLTKGQTLKEFDEVAYSLAKGEMSAPILSPAGYHIILMKDRGNFFPYDSVHADILRFIDQRGLRESIIDNKLKEIAAEQHVTPAQILDAKAAEMSAEDMDLKYLIQEYHDGLLLYEISNSTVWDKAAKDEAGLANYFNKNKKKYKWEQPRFKGIAYHVKDVADVKAVKAAVKNLPFDQWAEKLRTTFNNDSVLRIRVEKGIFKQGDNALVDREIFKKDTTVKQLKDYPYDAVFGKKLKAPQSYQDVRNLVLTDYQEQLEKEWVAGLRKKYAVKVDETVLKTVNKHE